MTKETMRERELALARILETTHELAWVTGRLDGLAGTVRYDIPDALRAEIKECADRLRKLLPVGAAS